MVSDAVDRHLLRIEEEQMKHKTSLADILKKKREAEDKLYQMELEIAALEGKLELCQDILAGFGEVIEDYKEEEM